MKIIRNLSIKRRIQLVVGLLLLFLYAMSGVTVYSFSSKRLQKSIQNQMEVYLDNLSAFIDEVEKNSEPGFNQNDYASLKPYFSKPAYYSTDFPFMVDASGLYTIHLYREGQRFPRERLNQIFSSADSKGNFEYTEVQNNKQQKVTIFFKKINKYNSFVGVPVNLNEANQDLNDNRFVLILLVVFGSLLFIVIINIAITPIVNAIVRVNKNLGLMANGEVVKSLEYKNHDEVGNIVLSLNTLIEGLSKTAKFATELGQNNLDAEYSPLGPNDKLGNALIDMRESLKRATIEEEKRKQEDSQRNWINSGLAQFADILRQNNNNLQSLADNVTKNLLNYLNANQGGLFIINDDNDEDPCLELVSAYAYNRKKFKQKTIAFGEGLVGNCAIEKQTIYLKEIPEDYIEITSGLGDAPPRSLLITPLKLEDKVFGVIEIASFNELQPFEIEFIEKIGESISSTLSAVKNSIRTTQLLEQSQQQREEMAAQEEEMRQNMEEMQATQEEMARKTIEMEGMSSAINEAMLFAELNEEGYFQNINSNFLSLLGYTKSDIEDKVVNTFIYPTDISAFNELWRSVKSGTTFKGALRWINRQNEELYILSSISPALDEVGEIFKIFFLGQDVTTSKQIELKAQEQAEEIEQNLIELQAEQELAQQREEEIAALLKALDSTCLVAELDPDGRITFINAKNEEVLGDSKDDIVGKMHSDIDFEAKHNPQAYQQFWANLRDGIPQKREFSLKVKNKLVWISEHFTPITGSDGIVNKIIDIGIDISASKNAELNLQQQVEELNKQIRGK
jgi:methyl-accepting chemotaxis protein